MDERATGGSSGVEAELLGLLTALRQAMSGFASAHPPQADGQDLPTTCGVCPICLTIASLSRTRPELIRHLGDAATSLTAALACLTHPESGASADQSGTRDEGSPGPDRPGRESRPRSQVIDID